MDLDSAYQIANILNEKIMEGIIDKTLLSQFVITVKVSPEKLYGIDKEFYRISHDGDLENFEHSNEVSATIDGVKFNFVINKLTQ